MKHSVATLLLLTGIVHGQDQKVLSLSGRIELPNVNGRIDHFSADTKGKRLFMSELGNNTVEVLDVDSGNRIRPLTDLDEPHGAYSDSSTNRLFVACAKDGTTKVVDA